MSIYSLTPPQRARLRKNPKLRDLVFEEIKDYLWWGRHRQANSLLAILAPIESEVQAEKETE
jgi:hypothetical protein